MGSISKYVIRKNIAYQDCTSSMKTIYTVHAPLALCQCRCSHVLIEFLLHPDSTRSSLCFFFLTSSANYMETICIGCRPSTRSFRIRKTWARATRNNESAKRSRCFVLLVPRSFLYGKADVRGRYPTYTPGIREVES